LITTNQVGCLEMAQAFEIESVKIQPGAAGSIGRRQEFLFLIIVFCKIGNQAQSVLGRCDAAIAHFSKVIPFDRKSRSDALL